eukprot:jgi/Botrbrau1/22613/Bobra.176_1s0043.1
MGSALSRSGTRSLPNKNVVTKGQRFPEVDFREREVIGRGFAESEADPTALLSEEDLRDRNVAAIWNQMRGSITPHAVAVSDPKVAMPKQTRTERLAMLKGRLDSRDIRALLREYEERRRLGTPDFPALAAKFGIDQDLLQKVVRYNRSPLQVPQLPEI